MNKLFCISLLGYETYVPYFLYGPETYTKDSFDALCRENFAKASLIAIEQEKKKEYPGWVGTNEIVECLLPLLEKFGFFKFKAEIVEFMLAEDMIIDSENFKYNSGLNILGSSLKAVIEWNEFLKNKITENFK